MLRGSWHPVILLLRPWGADRILFGDPPAPPPPEKKMNRKKPPHQKKNLKWPSGFFYSFFLPCFCQVSEHCQENEIREKRLGRRPNFLLRSSGSSLRSFPPELLLLPFRKSCFSFILKKIPYNLLSPSAISKGLLRLNIPFREMLPRR